MTAQQAVAEVLARPTGDPAGNANLERRDWAAEVLGVPAETDPRAARAAFARQLQQAEFVPPDAWRAAYETLSGQPAALWPALGHEAYLIDREPRLRGEVESLAREFFELPVVQRADRYRRLHARLQEFPQLRARLESLEIGLPVERLELLDSKPWVHELAGSACRLFVLRPLPRAIARQQMLPHFAPEISQWQLTARVLQQHYPQVAALAPELIDELLDWHARRQRIAKGRKAAVPKPVTKVKNQGTVGGKSAAWILIVVAIGIVRAISVSSSSKPTYTPTNPRFPYTTPGQPFGAIPMSPADRNSSQPEPTADEIIEKLLRESRQTPKERDKPRSTDSQLILPEEQPDAVEPAVPMQPGSGSVAPPLGGKPQDKPFVPGEAFRRLFGDDGEKEVAKPPPGTSPKSDDSTEKAAATDRPMSESHLPDDFSAWPSDPYELLRVAPNVDRRALRSAYTQLIRQYKPERFPDQFRAIRTAYDTVLRHVQWREDHAAATAERSLEFPVEPPEPKALPQAEVVPEPDEIAGTSDDATQDETRRLRPRILSLDEELDALWEQFFDGNEVPAYARLVELERQYPGNGQLCGRLYWLLFLQPELDSRRHRCDWLAAGLRASGLRGPLAELYRRELQSEPGEVLRDRCRLLLQTDGPPAALANLAEWRWSAAGRQGYWKIIEYDLTALRERMTIHADEAWGRLLVSAIDQLAWSDRDDSRKLMQACLEEVEQLHHVLTDLRRLLDRTDYLLIVAEGWQKFGRLYMPANSTIAGLREKFQRVIPGTWLLSRAEMRRELALLARDLAALPFETLSLFDRLWGVSHPLLAHFNESLAALRPDDPTDEELDSRTPDAVRALAQNFFEEHYGGSYLSLRQRLLWFCIREAIDPRQIAELANAACKVRGTANLPQTLADDVPLHCAWRVHRLYGA